MTDQTTLPPRTEFQTGVKNNKARHGTGSGRSSGPADREPEETYHLIIEARELTWIRIKADQ